MGGLSEAASSSGRGCDWSGQTVMEWSSEPGCGSCWRVPEDRSAYDLVSDRGCCRPFLGTPAGGARDPMEGKVHPGGARALRGLEQDPASPGQSGGLAGGGSPLAGPGGEPGWPRWLQPTGLSLSSEDPPWVGAHLLRFTWRGPKLGAVSLTPAQFACPQPAQYDRGVLGPVPDTPTQTHQPPGRFW